VLNIRTELHKDGYRIVFFTNQAGIEKLKVTPEVFMKKTEDIIKEIGVPIYVRLLNIKYFIYFYFVKQNH
jgi:histidinol phosphatase-like enzyme